MFPIYKFWKDGQPMPSWNAKYAREGLPAEDETAYLSQPYVQTLLPFLPERAHVLDAGCGTGGLMRFLHRRGFHVTGVDASTTAMETARTVVPGAAIALATLEQLPFPASSFDAYLAIGSWEYAADGPVRAAEEAARVVKPGGLVCVEVPYANIVRRLLYLPLKRLEYAWKRDAGETPTLAHYVFTIHGVRGALQRAGLTVVRIEPHDLPEPTRFYGLWVDWPFLRGGPQYELNGFGRLVKRLATALSPWTISTGMFMVARKP